MCAENETATVDRSPPFHNARVGLSEDTRSAVLFVTLDREELRETDATVIKAFNTEGSSRDLITTIQIDRSTGSSDMEGDSDYVTKRHDIGALPVSGTLRVEVQNADGNQLGFRQFSYNCVT